MFMCPILYRSPRKASDRRRMVIDRMEAGFQWRHAFLREAETDSCRFCNYSHN